ncbi:hypothetical protein BC835DRAFT_1307434 [Cytidiella melzeri]|nr:hypothetical protein BC835DRAFT_1307434 [Cytidiella melzeri]
MSTPAKETPTDEGSQPRSMREERDLQTSRHAETSSECVKPNHEPSVGVLPDIHHQNSMAKGASESKNATNPPVVKRRSKTAEERKLAKGGKRGNPGCFKDDMYDFLNSYVEDYQKLPAMKAPGRVSALAKFWEKVITQGFWTKYMVEEARDVLPQGDGTGDDEVMSEIEKAIKSWYRRHSAEHSGNGPSSLWFNALKDLRKPVDVQTKKLAGWQWYLNQNLAKVNAVFEVARGLPENEGLHPLHLRSNIARKLYAELGDKEKEKVAEEIEAEYHAKAKEIENLESAPASDPKVQANARRGLAKVITPLLEAISEITGLENLTLLGGTAPYTQVDSYEVAVVHFGKIQEVVPRDFSEFNQDGFRLHVLSHFCKFLSATRQGGANIPTESASLANLNLNLTIPDKDDNVSSSGPTAEAAKVVSTSRKSPSQADSSRPQRKTQSSTSAAAVLLATSESVPKVATVQKPKPATAETPVVMLRPGANSKLLRAVNALSGEQKRAEIERLNTLSDMEFRWANSDAMMVALNGGEPDQDHVFRSRLKPIPVTFSSAQPDSVSRSMSRSASPSAVPESTFPNAPDHEPELELSTSSETSGNVDATSAVTSASPDLHTSDAEPTPLISSATLENQLPTLQLPTDVPEWIEKHSTRLLTTTIPAEFKAQWTRMIENWSLLEKALGFNAKQKPFTRTGRPQAISLWNQNARKRSVVIKPDKHAEFTGEWFVWWKEINPKWRQQDDDKHLLIGGTGDWTDMFKPGPCGFLLVLKCLRGLSKAASIDDLGWSLRDVDWVMYQVLNALNSGEPESADEQEKEDEGASVLAGSGPRARRKRPTATDTDEELEMTSRKGTRRGAK